jgi:hypothetical protein
MAVEILTRFFRISQSCESVDVTPTFWMSEIGLKRCSQEAGLASAERLPVARVLGATSRMVLVHPAITPAQTAGYAEALPSLVKRACC